MAWQKQHARRHAQAATPVNCYWDILGLISKLHILFKLTNCSINPCTVITDHRSQTKIPHFLAAGPSHGLRWFDKMRKAADEFQEFILKSLGEDRWVQLQIEMVNYI